MQSKAEVGAPKNEALEALRGVAALTVFVYHAIQQWPDFPRGPFLFLHKGLIGVDLFLVISGFVTTSSLLALRASGRPDADREYWRRRAARIFPLFWLASVFYVFVAPFGTAPLREGGAWFQVLTHVTMTHGFFPSTWISINAVTWTLTLEGALYVFGWTMLRFADPERHAVRWTLAVFAAVIAWRSFVFFGLPPERHAHMVTQVFGMLDGFWLGLLMAVVVHRGRFTPASWSFAARTALAVAGLLGVHGLVSVMEAAGPAYWQSPWCVVLVRTGLACAFAALLCVVLGVRSFPRWLAPLAHAGTISYGIYLWHLPVLLCLLQWDAAPWLRAAAGLAITLVLSEASYRWFEAPIVRRVRR